MTKTESSLSRRQKMKDVFAGRVPAVPPVCVRLDLWFQDADSRGTLPDVLSGRNVADAEDLLGFCRSARYRAHPRLAFPEGWVTRSDSEEESRTSYRLPGLSLYKVERRTADQIRAGMRGAIVKYPVTSERECRALLAALDRATLAADLDGFSAFDRETGDAGLPLLILGSCPTHALMLEWFGYEHFFYALADYPELLSELIGALDGFYRRELWEPAMQTGSELIMHGNHFSDVATPPPLFSRFFLPYFQAFIARAHAAEKRVLWHADAAMPTLLELVQEAGFDGADCLATAPLVAETIGDHDRIWKGRRVATPCGGCIKNRRCRRGSIRRPSKRSCDRLTPERRHLHSRRFPYSRTENRSA